MDTCACTTKSLSYKSNDDLLRPLLKDFVRAGARVPLLLGHQVRDVNFFAELLRPEQYQAEVNDTVLLSEN